MTGAQIVGLAIGSFLLGGATAMAAAVIIFGRNASR